MSLDPRAAQLDVVIRCVRPPAHPSAQYRKRLRHHRGLRRAAIGANCSVFSPLLPLLRLAAYTERKVRGFGLPVPYGGRTVVRNLPQTAAGVAARSDRAVWEYGGASTVPLTALTGGLSPRTCGEDAEHVRRLLESGVSLPPIVVHRPTMRVVDGMHRLSVARLRGQRDIAVVFFDGDDNEAFELAVQLNVAHGLPLTLAERRSAAARLLTMRPEWSDRRVAESAGLSPKTVGVVRRTTAEIPQLTTRAGRDGRTRAVPSMRKRRESEVGRRTVPIPASQTTADDGDVGFRRRRTDVIPALAALQKDPSLCLSDSGRLLLSLLRALNLSAEQSEALEATVPRYQRAAVASIIRACAQRWLWLAQHLERP